MYSVGQMKKALAGLDDEQPLAVIYFRKTDLEELIEGDLTAEQWKQIAEKFHRNEYLDMECAHAIRDYASELVEVAND